MRFKKTSVRVFSLIIFTVLTFVLVGCSSLQDRPATKTDYDVIVIASGLGGLSAAPHLAVKGQKVPARYTPLARPTYPPL